MKKIYRKILLTFGLLGLLYFSRNAYSDMPVCLFAKCSEGQDWVFRYDQYVTHILHDREPVAHINTWVRNPPVNLGRVAPGSSKDVYFDSYSGGGTVCDAGGEVAQYIEGYLDGISLNYSHYTAYTECCN